MLFVVFSNDVECNCYLYLAWLHLNIVGFWMVLVDKFVCEARRKLLIDNEDASRCCTLFTVLQASIILDIMYNKFKHSYEILNIIYRLVLPKMS